MDEKKLMLIVALGTVVIVAASMRSLKQVEEEQRRITAETIKVLGEYRQYIAEQAKNN